MSVCRHCHNPKRKVNRPRGLCWHCFHAPGVRDLYPVNPALRPDLVDDDPSANMTDAELDALIAERRATMPGARMGQDGMGFLKAMLARGNK